MATMGEDEPRKYIVAKAVVRRQQVAIAKAVILRACVCGASSESLITEVLRHNPA